MSGIDLVNLGAACGYFVIAVRQLHVLDSVSLSWLQALLPACFGLAGLASFVAARAWTSTPVPMMCSLAVGVTASVCLGIVALIFVGLRLLRRDISELRTLRLRLSFGGYLLFGVSLALQVVWK